MTTVSKQQIEGLPFKERIHIPAKREVFFQNHRLFQVPETVGGYVTAQIVST